MTVPYCLDSMRPSFLIVGSMKAGTSALVRGIANHDSVFRAEGKEVHYFDRHYDNGIDWYQSRFDNRGRATAFGEGTPYLGNEVAMGRLLADLPDTKLIVILRQPADRAYSHYWHNRRRGREELSFPDALAAEEERTGPNDTIFDYKKLGFYSGQLSQIKEARPAEQLLVLFNQDLKHQREATLRATWEFVGVDPDRGRLEVPARSGTKRFWRSAKNRVKGRTDDRSYPPMDPTERASLTEEFARDIQALQELVGRDLGGWLR